MPIIYTYPSATPTASDLILISDVSSTNPTKATRKCTIGDVVSLVTALVPGGGTVTSVGLSGGTTGLTIATTTTNPITTTGTFTVGGTLVVANGGTGANTLTGVIHGNGTGAFTASNVDLTSEVTGVLPEANGGTGESTYTKGDILYCNSTGANLTKLAIGADGTLLNVATDLPAWTTATAAGLVTSVQVSGGATGLVFTGGPITTTGTITLASGQLIVANGGTGAATHTSGYFLKGAGTSPITSQQYIDLTADVTGTLPIENGGTERNTLTQHAVLVGNGTAAVQMIGPLTNGQLLIGSAGAAPVATTLTAGANVTITNGAGIVTIAAASSTAPVKVNWDAQLNLAGGTSGTLTPPALTNLAHYWTSGDYAYLEFYMEWTGAHGCVGTMLIQNLPLGAAIFNPLVEQGSCLITRNDYLGYDATHVAPKTGIVGATGLKEVLLRTTTDATFGVLTDSLWSNVAGEGGPFKLAGTIQWLITQD
tara:strand:- start:62 stop:1507 length:1446 start_codon:yes stop_codon:yes gene_type:complete